MARTPVEKMICSSDALANLDVKLTTAYHEAQRVQSEQGRTVRQEQIAWLKLRDQCQNEDCVAKAYLERLAVLEGLIAPVDASSAGAGSLTGSYQSADGGSLDIIHHPDGTLEFQLLAIWVGGVQGVAHTGEAAGKVRLEGKTAVYKTEDCQITMTANDGSLELSQDTNVGLCGFGMNVIADGTYRRTSSETPTLQKI